MKNILNKIFKKKESKKEKQMPTVEGSIVYQNDHVNIVHDSCRICYNKKVEADLEKKMKYISDKVKLGHESILEHSNIIMKLRITGNAYEELSEILNTFRYLNIITKTNDSDSVTIVLGGSIRGYKHIIRTITNPHNTIYSAIHNTLKQLPYCYFVDLIEEEIYSKAMFNYYSDHLSESIISSTSKQDDNIVSKTIRHNYKVISTELFDIVWSDDLEKILNELNKEVEEYTIYDILDLTSITILFKKLSRTASHQLVRHRGGITQLSQRYVNVQDSQVLTPELFKKEIENDKKYEIEIGDRTVNITLAQLGEMLKQPYSQLIEQGLLREDARAFLPSNIETSLYMTFTYKNFIKFLQLRTGKTAQAEIRLLALELEKVFVFDIMKNDDMYGSYLYDRYKIRELELLHNVKCDELLE